MDKDNITENEENIIQDAETETAEPVKEAEESGKTGKKEKKDKKASEELKKKIEETEDKYLRLRAEYDNFRKRSQKEKTDIYSSSRAEIINDFLPILDNFERAAADTGADPDAYRKGVELIFNQFLKVLEKYGVESFGEEGDTFDPSIHSAVMVVEDDSLGENVVAQVFSKGYRLGDRIIREAVVKVANT